MTDTERGRLDKATRKRIAKIVQRLNSVLPEDFHGELRVVYVHGKAHQQYLLIGDLLAELLAE